MYIVKGTNVNDIYHSQVRLLKEEDMKEARGRAGDPQGREFTHRRASRYGDVIEFNEPVTTVYRHPWECALLDAGRNVNPFFHFMEALWILAGRDDVAFVERYAKKMREFSDDGKTFHGAYGKRWRHHFRRPCWSSSTGNYTEAVDQLDRCCEILSANHEERRAVLTMWDPAADLGHVGKDIPCNTHVYLKVRRGELIATVCCRSNDMLWGAYGTNATQFGFLMAYVAARVGVPIGWLHQVSDSLHVYENVWAKTPAPAPVRSYPGTRALVDSPEDFLLEAEQFCLGEGLHYAWQNGIFKDTAWPMHEAWGAWKESYDDLALIWARRIAAPDWGYACVAWLERAIAKKKEKVS